ncbi:MAG: response regulator transcription factor [Treponema sp.]|jgi:DNA-binding NarL/FixJ family response regulator|nr:response regulator transcription factor [Treponema sp.]
MGINILIASEDAADTGMIFDILSNENDFNIINIVKDEPDAIIKTANIRPDILILAFSQSKILTPELISILHRRSPSTKIILFSDIAEDRNAGKALKEGVSAYMLKETDMDKLIPVIRIVNSGGCYINTSLTIRAFNAVTSMTYFPGQFTERKKSTTVFSATERTIITFIAKGLSDNEIAENMNFHIGTVRNYLFAIKRRLKLKTRVQIVVFSIIKGLINFDSILGDF